MKKEIYRKPMQSSQNTLPIKEIRQGIVITKDDRYIRILEIRAGGFSLKTIWEKMEIQERFMLFLRTAPANLQFTVMTVPADLSQQIAEIDRNLEQETSQGCKAMCLEYRNRVQASARTGVKHRYFLSFEYEKPMHGRVEWSRVVNTLEQTTWNLIPLLENCETEVVPLDWEETSTQTAEILYMVLNRKKTMIEPFAQHQQRIRQKYAESIGSSDFMLPIEELIAPERMNFQHARDVIVNDTYYKFLYLLGKDGYCAKVYPGWLAPLLQAFDGVDVNIWLNRQYKQEVYESIRRNIYYSQTDMLETGENSVSFEKASSADRAGRYLRDGMQNGADFYYAAVMITVSGDSLEQVNWKVQQLKMLADGMQIRLKEALFQNEQALWSSLPLAHMDESLWQKAKRNMLTDGAASLYPFTVAEYQDPNGIYLGNTGQTPVIYDLFDKKKHVNANIIVSGTSGAGKTYSVFLLAARLREAQIPVYLIMPEKENEARRLCEALDGQFIQLAPGSPNRLNILDIFYQSQDANEWIDGEHEQASCLSEKVESLKAFFSLTMDPMDAESLQLLDQALMQTYQKKGITTDNASLFSDEAQTIRKPMPVIADLQKELRQMHQRECDRMANILRIFVDGSGSNFNGQTNVDLKNKFIVFGLEKCNRQMLPIALFMAMDYVWSRVKEDRVTKSMLMIDEFWRFAYHPVAIEYALDIAKTIRGYNAGLILATQQLSDLYKLGNTALGDGILNNCATKIIMKQERKDAEIAQRVWNLSQDLVKKIVSFTQGEGLLINGTDVLTLTFQASPAEHRLIATDAESLLAYQKEQREKKQEERIRKRKAALFEDLSLKREEETEVLLPEDFPTDPEEDMDEEDSAFEEWEEDE